MSVISRPRIEERHLKYISGSTTVPLRQSDDCVFHEAIFAKMVLVVETVRRIESGLRRKSINAQYVYIDKL
jgi:hypothetical protein